MQNISKEVLHRAIRRGKFHQKQLMYGIGFFREWQINPPLNGECWIIDKDFQVRKEKCKIGLKSFNRAYKNYQTFLNKKDALHSRALIFRALKQRQIELYAADIIHPPLSIPCKGHFKEKIEQLEIFDLDKEKEKKNRFSGF